MTGYVMLDVFTYLSDSRCSSHGLPKGACFLARQTTHTLQQVALGTIIISCSKDGLGDLWSQGHARMSELGIEEWFGRLRSQSSNSQLTTRCYWRAAARQMLHECQDRAPGVAGKQYSPTASLTNKEFHECSVRAFKSALEIASFCSGLNADDLAERYSNYCLSGVFDEYHADEEDDCSSEGDGDEECGGSKGQCPEVLTDLQTDAQMDSDLTEASLLQFELRHVPDATELELLTKAEPESPEKPFHAAGIQEDAAMGSHSRTLYHALFASPGSNMWDQLWRLTMHLRHWNGGSDSHWLKNPRSARKASSKLSWAQCLDSQQLGVVGGREKKTLDRKWLSCYIMFTYI